VRTNTELNDLYAETSPSKKRVRVEEIDDNLQRFMFVPKKESQEGLTFFTNLPSRIFIELIIKFSLVFNLCTSKDHLINNQRTFCRN